MAPVPMHHAVKAIRKVPCILDEGKRPASHSAHFNLRERGSSIQQTGVWGGGTYPLFGIEPQSSPWPVTLLTLAILTLVLRYILNWF